MLIALLFWDENALMMITTATITGMMVIIVIVMKKMHTRYQKITGKLDPIVLGITETSGVSQTR